MNIKDTFIKLTSETYPYGYEEKLLHFLPDGYKMDLDGNYYYEVGYGSKNIFACHLDTACKAHQKVTHVLNKNIIKTNGKTILGADDKAGMTIILYMIYKNVPGLYYFFVGEEVGCIGSTAASKRIGFFSDYNKIVSFDRRGTTSIITHQSGSRSCSDEFADSLSKQFAKFNLNLEKDDTGVYTDSAEFTEVISECTNISVGYYKEHTTDEHQDIQFLEKLAKACVLVDWDSLEVKRDPTTKEWKQYNYTGYGKYMGGTTTTNSFGNRGTSTAALYHSSYKDWEDWENYNYDSYRSSKRNRSRRGKKDVQSVDFGRMNNRNMSDTEFFGDKYKKKESGKIYLNDIDNQVEGLLTEDRFKIDLRHKTDYYKGVRSLFLDDKISADEFEIIKEQCLNLNDDSDKDFVKYMESNLASINNV